MNWWSKEIPNDYARMERYHPDLWLWIKNFIKEKQIKSLLDVGAGLLSPVKDAVPIYQAIDLHPQSNAIHDDFTTMDVTPLIGKYELLLAAGVIEHCEGYSKFFEQIVKVKPKYAIVTFFHGLGVGKKEAVGQDVFKGGLLWFNRYSLPGVKAKLDSLGLSGKYEIILPGNLKKNTLVFIAL